MQLVSVGRKTAPTQMPSCCSHCNTKCFIKDLLVCFSGPEDVRKVLNFQEEGLGLYQGGENIPSNLVQEKQMK